MASLVSHISDLAGAVRDKFNLVMPRLLPPGGATGQILAKASNADNSVEWVDAPSGSGSSGSTAQKASYRGEFGAGLVVENVTFDDGTIPAWSYSGAMQLVDDPDSNVGTTKALVFPDLDPSNGTGWLEFNVEASSAPFDELIVHYKVESEAGYDMFRIYVDGTEAYSDSGIQPYKTATVPLSAGTHTIRLELHDDANATDGFNNVHFSQISYPAADAVNPYVYGDTVTYSGETYLCLKGATTETPGEGDEWQVIPSEPDLSNYATSEDVADALPPKGMSFFCSGIPADGEVIGGGIAPYAFTVTETNCAFDALTAATSATTLTIKKNGSQIATVTFSAGATSGILSVTSSAIATGDNITIHNQATADATLGDITGLLRA